MKESKEMLKDWERESASMYTGWVASVIYEGVEYLIDSKRVDEAKSLGARPVPFRLY